MNQNALAELERDEDASKYAGTQTPGASVQNDFFLAKGDGPGRVAEVRTRNVRRGLATREVPKGRENLMFDESRLKAAREADLARWKSLGAPGDFDSWVESKYRGETGRKPAGAATVAMRTASDYVSGRNPSGTISQLRAGVDAPIRGLMEVVRAGIVRPEDYKDREARDLERYAEMRSAAPKPMGFSGTMKALGDVAASDGGLRMLAADLINPDDMLLNAVTAIPVAGIGGKAAGLAARSERLAAAAPKLSRAAGAAERALLTSKAAPVLGIAGDAAVGGTLNAIQQNQNFGDDFQAGSIPGAIIGAATAGLGRAGKAVASKIGSKAPSTPKVHPIEQSIATLAESKGTRVVDQTGAPVLNPDGSEVWTPASKADLTAEDLISSPTIFKALTKGVPAKADADAVHAIVAEHGKKFVPDLDKFSTKEAKLDAVSAAARDMASRKATEAAAPKATSDVSAKIEAARQQLPTTKENEDVWFSTGTKKQQDDKLVKAARAYRFLRDQGAIDENPRFEGKTEVDILSDRLKQIQKETEEAKAIEAKGSEQEALKQELLDENNFRSEALRKEIDWAEKKEQALSDINFAGTVQVAHGVPGRVLDEFKSMPVEHQGIFLRDIDEMGSAGDFVKTALDTLFDDLRRIASTSGYDPKRLRAKIDEAVGIIKKSYGKPSEGLNGIVGGTPTGRAAADGQMPAEGSYSSVPQGHGFDHMGQEIGAQGRQGIGYSEPSAPSAPAASPTPAIEGSAPVQIGYDPSRAGGQINLPDQSTGKPSILMRDEPIGSRNELLDHQDVRKGELSASRERLTMKKSEEEIAKILYDEILKDPSKAEFLGIDRDLAMEAKEPDSRFKGDLKAQLVDVAKDVKAKGLPKGFF